MAGPRDQRAYNKCYYRRERDREIVRVRTRQNETVALLRGLRDRPCADCGGSFAPYQMDFDHTDRATKRDSVTRMAGRAGINRILAEVAKCEIVCANRHRIRTHAHEVSRPRTDRSRGPSAERKRAAWHAHAAILAGLRNVPCADCEQRFPPCAMDFDHRDPATKSHTVTRMVGRAEISLILAEVAKCDIVCANCHRTRTFHRRTVRVAKRE